MASTASTSPSGMVGDEGWSHYVDRFEVLDDNRKMLGTRTILHPHVDEQPFMRSLSIAEIPESVVVRAHDLVHGDWWPGSVGGAACALRWSDAHGGTDGQMPNIARPAGRRAAARIRLAEA